MTSSVAADVFFKRNPRWLPKLSVIGRRVEGGPVANVCQTLPLGTGGSHNENAVAIMKKVIQRLHIRGKKYDI